MGSKSRSKSSNTSQSTQNTMNNLAKGAVSNEKVAGMQQSLADSQMANVGGMFGAMIKDGMSMFGENPMMSLMGSMLGMPVQIQTPDAMQEFLAKYAPKQEPQRQTQQQQFGAMPPQQPVFDINQHMRNQFMR